MSRKTPRVISDKQWQKTAPLFPSSCPAPKGGRPRIGDRRVPAELARADSPKQTSPNSVQTNALIAVSEVMPVIADNGHDCDDLRDELEAEGLVPVIPTASGA